MATNTTISLDKLFKEVYSGALKDLVYSKEFGALFKTEKELHDEDFSKEFKELMGPNNDK